MSSKSNVVGDKYKYSTRRNQEGESHYSYLNAVAQVKKMTKIADE